MVITDETPLAMLNVGHLRGIILDVNSTHHGVSAAPKHYVYGLKGICDLFSCGLSRAQELKRTVIADAVSQNGRTIVTDADLALELFSKASGNNKNK